MEEQLRGENKRGGIKLDKKLKEISDMLDKFNSKINLVNKKDLDEQYDNLEDFKVLIRDLDITFC